MKLGQVRNWVMLGQKTRSLGQILDKHRGHSSEQKSMKLCQNFNSHKPKSSLKLGHVGSKIRSLGQIIKKKPCVRLRGHSSDQKFMKLCQNVNSYKI